jgi:hypothetical protein
MPRESPPLLCPACGGKRVLPIIWGWRFLIEGEKADAEAGLVILGCRHASGVRVGRTVPRHHPEVLGAPDWACLDCEPGWLDVHRLALEEQEQHEAMERALASLDAEAIWECLNRKDAINDRIVQRVRRLTSPKLSQPGAPSLPLG